MLSSIESPIDVAKRTAFKNWGPSYHRREMQCPDRTPTHKIIQLYEVQSPVKKTLHLAGHSTPFAGLVWSALGSKVLLEPVPNLPIDSKPSQIAQILVQKRLKKRMAPRKTTMPQFPLGTMPSPPPSPVLAPEPATVSLPLIDLAVLDLDDVSNTPLSDTFGLLHQIASQVAHDPQNHQLMSLFRLYHRQIQETRALVYFCRAAKQGSKFAMAMLGFYWEHGLGNLPINYQKAEFWYRRAAQPVESSPFGYAHPGAPLAQLRLAFLKMYGRPNLGIDQSLARHWRWVCNQQATTHSPLVFLKKAADAEMPSAQFSLASCYYNGIGTKKDDRMAFIWAGKAATFGHAGAQNLLGMLFVDGIGKEVPKDVVTGMRWYVRASAQGEAAAIYNIATLYERGLVHLPTAPDSLREAFGWYQRAANFGSISAANIVGLFYEQDAVGTEEDHLKLAVHWYSIAGKNGHPFGLYNFARCFMEGIGIEKDPKLGIECLERAAHQGHLLSRVSLGIVYEVGIGNPKNLQLALDWWKRAAMRGSREGIYRLKPRWAFHMLRASRILIASGTWASDDTDEAGMWSLPFEIKEQILLWLNAEHIMTRSQTKQVLKWGLDRDNLNSQVTRKDFLDHLQMQELAWDCPDCAWGFEDPRPQPCYSLRHWISRYSEATSF